MGKAFGMVLIVVGLWAGIEIYTEGMQGAFGGLFTKLGVEEPAEDPASVEKPMDRIRNAVSEDVEQGMERRERAMGDAPSESR